MNDLHHFAKGTSVKERRLASKTNLIQLPNCPALATYIVSPIAPWPKLKSLGNMPERMSFLRTLSSRLKLKL
jgi:hypothetical protein